jgi:hypothetical protein
MGLIVRDDGVLIDNNAIIVNFADGISVNEITAGSVSIFIGPNAIVESMIVDNAISSAKIQDNAITNAKITDNAITTSKIVDGAVTPAKLSQVYLTSTDLVKPAVLHNEATGNPAGTVISVGVTSLISDVNIVIPNDTQYDIVLRVYAMVQGNAVGNISIVHARFASLSGTVLVDVSASQSTQSWVGLMSQCFLAGRQNETIRAQLAIEASGGGITYRSWGAFFTGLPR